MAICLRDAEAQDVSSIARIQRLCFMGQPTDSRQLGNVVTTVATLQGVVAGYSICSMVLVPSRIIVLSIAVHPEYRRVGVATQLLEAAQCASVIADRRVRILGGATNSELSSLLHSVGFRIVDARYGIRIYEWGTRKHEHDGFALVRRSKRSPAARPLAR
jgi:ribosomal protein S18 acetylase RimI-like enzyme